MWPSKIISLNKSYLKDAIVVVLSISIYKYISESGKCKDSNGEKLTEKIKPPTPVSENNTDEYNREFLERGSSVWCRGENTSQRLCRFRNLCLHPGTGEFLFLHGPKTIISGIYQTSQKEAVVDLSSIEGHNNLQLVYVDVPAERVMDMAKNVRFVDGRNWIMKRFKPNNVMHVFHDDLLPLHSSLCEIDSCDGPASVRLVFVDQRKPGPFWDLYKLFTKLPIVLWNDMEKDDLYCFKEAYIGLNRNTIWYQYGFSKYQGPQPNNRVTSSDINRFKSFFTTALQSQLIPNECPEPSIGILLTRNNTRLILNEEELIQAMTRELQIPVLKFSLDSHSLVDIISHVRCAKTLVGVHGALLVVAMFLQPGTSFVELFPFAIPPERYTPYKTLADIPGMGIAYRSWRNTIEANTITHADWPKEYGGISHLPLDQQAAIYTNKEILPHNCCSNPYWLFRIYQDTYVEIDSFLEVFRAAVETSKGYSLDRHLSKVREIEEAQMFPGRVAFLDCRQVEQKAAMKLTWKQPWNVALLKTPYKTGYEIWIQAPGETSYRVYPTDETEKVIEANRELNVWVRCKFGNKFGPFRWVVCNKANSSLEFNQSPTPKV